MFEPSKNITKVSGVVIQIFVAISWFYPWKQAQFCNMLHRSHQSFPFRTIFHCTSSHNDNDIESNIERETNVDDGIGWYFDTSICSNSKRTHFKCLELCKPTCLEPMSAHHANLVLWWQTFISPTLITSLIKKYYKDIRCSDTIFFFPKCHHYHLLNRLWSPLRRTL